MTPRRGFTLLEVLLVLAVIVMLGAMAWPSIEAMYGDVRLSAAADQIRARWADARTQAIEEGQPYRFAIQTGGRYRIAPDTTDKWGGSNATGTATAADANSDTPSIDVEESLPKGVNFAEGIAGEPGDGEWQTVVRFLPDGSASKDVEIVFETAGSRPLRLRLRGLTGSVSVQTDTTEKRP
jgi:prepilin-type N-terminal cleavage/methylation domain-containing protein